MGGRSGKAKPEKRKKQRRGPPLGHLLTGALSKERRTEERRGPASRAADCLFVRGIGDLAWFVTPEGSYRAFVLGAELQPKTYPMGTNIGRPWRVAAVGREGFQMVVDLKPDGDWMAKVVQEEFRKHRRARTNPHRFRA